ncbi:hypothetical protein L1987_87274 [Smallanthus sonchifolius]|nr:hypothetical protein L1987_87274 [Smallanthus sonchifolius]
MNETSARAYSIMGFEIGSNKWMELGVPKGDTEISALVIWGGKLTVVGGVHDGNVVVWELGEGGELVMIERMATELGNRFTEYQVCYVVYTGDPQPFLENPKFCSQTHRTVSTANFINPYSTNSFLGVLVWVDDFRVSA